MHAKCIMEFPNDLLFLDITDALWDGRGQMFSTYDLDRDSFAGSCARIYGGGGWLNACGRANIFGKVDVWSGCSMCWKGLPSQNDMCTPLTGLLLALKFPSKDNATKIVFSYIETDVDGKNRNNVKTTDSSYTSTRSYYYRHYYTTTSPPEQNSLCLPKLQKFTIRGKRLHCNV